MARKGIRGSWLGGRTFTNPETHETVWVIERQRASKRRAIRLDVRNETEALAELALYNRDPDSYLPESKRRRLEEARVARDCLFLTTELREQFLADLRERGRSEQYVRYTCDAQLQYWERALSGRDIKQVTLQELQVHVKNKAGRRQRLVALKSFTHWLRRTGLLRQSEDPTLALALPAIRPERGVRQKGYQMAHVEKIYALITQQSIRDVVLLHCKVGMHGSEISRLASGEATIKLVEGHSEIAATITFPHKNGEPHCNSVDAQTLAAARRLLTRGSAPATTWIARHIRGVAKQAGIEPIRMGELRHSFVGWCYEHGREVHMAGKGVSLAAIAAAVGHRSQATTRKFYFVAQVPAMIALPINLSHPRDPSPNLLSLAPDDKLGVKAGVYVSPPEVKEAVNDGSGNLSALSEGRREEGSLSLSEPPPEGGGDTPDRWIQ